ncbi:MAG: DUF3575 domain-containing protein [Bacteroidales bacterium]|nr:DUF3575 domain-containing protein [Bacteroidales bacterium]
MSTKIKLILIVIIMIAFRGTLSAQRIALTSNLLEDAVLTPNIGVDIVVEDRQSLTFDASFSPYKVATEFYNKRMTLRAGYKYWLDQALYAHYLGADVVLSSSDVGVGKFNSRDQYVGVGVGYGYSFILGKRWNVAPHIGVGVAYCKTYEGSDHMVKPGEGVEATCSTGIKPIITRMGVTLQYVLR